MANDLYHASARGGGPIESNSQARFPWWSITKSVLAAAVLRLVDDGRLSLDAPCNGRCYTIRQLLQHTAGLISYGGEPYQAAVAAGDPVWPVEDLLSRVNAGRLIFPPGEGWAYSNVGYLFVRQLIEEQTGRALDDALRLLVFEPMGIRRTQIAKTPDDMKQIFWGNPRGYDPGWVYHGLLIGPASDAVIFLRMLFSGFLSDVAGQAMKQMRPLGGSIPGRPWTEIGYGLGLMMGRMRGAGTVFGHSGAGPASVSCVYCFPEAPDQPCVAVFGCGMDEGVTESEAVRLAIAR